MSELRQNLLTKEWVIIANERARRPNEFVSGKATMTHLRPARVATCPFCPGNEDETGPDVLRWPVRGDWKLRLFANRYPALEREGARVHCLDGGLRKLSGVGYHEVLVQTPEHNRTIALQTPGEVELLLKAFQTRGRELLADPRIEHIIYFKNHGSGAGASLEHPHCQLLALPMVPYDMRRRTEEVRRTIDDEGACPMCTMLAMELKDGDRLVAQNEFFAAFIPYAAPTPFHVWIVPRRHGPTYLDQYPVELNGLARVLREVLARLYHGLQDPDYNFIIRSAPARDASSAYLHWYVTIVPRVTRTAGFELGSGMYINPAPPELSAAFLRDVVLPDEAG